MTQDAYETLPGGSIDYAHYITRGRKIRADEANRLFSKLRALLLPGRKTDPNLRRPEAGRVPLRKLRNRGPIWRRRQLATPRLGRSEIEA